MPRPHVEFPQQSWKSFQNSPVLEPLLRNLPGPWDLASFLTPEDWQERAVRVEGFRRLSLRFALEEKPGQRRRRKLPKVEQRSYEQWIFEDGEIPTRAENFHDFFNAMIWMNFPSSKLALHGRAREVQKVWPLDPDFQPGKRSVLSDRLTCFDEGGVVLPLREGEERAGIEALLAGRDDSAKAEFVRSRRESFILFGHGILEVLMNRIVAGQSIPRLNASCIILPMGGAPLDERLADYLKVLESQLPVHGTIDVSWLAE